MYHTAPMSCVDGSGGTFRYYTYLLHKVEHRRGDLFISQALLHQMNTHVLSQDVIHTFSLKLSFAELSKVKAYIHLCFKRM